MKHRITGLLAAGALVLASAACGGADDAAAGGSEPLRIGSVPATIISFPLEVADVEGFFQDEGLEADVVYGKTGSESFAAMIGGSTEITYAAPGTVVPAITQGQDLVVLPPYASPRIAIVASKKSGVTSLEELADKRLAVPTRGSSLELIYRSVFKEFDIPVSDATFVATGVVAPTIAALLNGQVDSAILATASMAALESQGGEVVVLADSKDGSMGERGELDVTAAYATTPEFAEKSPELVDKFCRAMKDSVEWIADEANEDAVVKRLATFLSIDEPVARTVYESERSSWALAIDEQKWDANVGFVDPSLDVPYEDVVDADCG